MVTGAVLQILLILAYLAIGLISVTFPIYAICVTYLKHEKWESEKERKKRIERVRSKISELTGKLGGERDAERVTRLGEQIEKYEIELKGTELGVQYLTAKGAVGIPVSYLVIALGAVGIGIYGFYEENWLVILLCGVISGVFSLMTLYSLYKTISAVEYAALRPARTIEFTVCYESEEKDKKIKRKKVSEIAIGARTVEEDLEHFEIDVFIPPELDIRKILTPGTVDSLQPEKAKYAHHIMLYRWERFLAKDTTFVICCLVYGEKIGNYKIPVSVTAKGIYEYRTELILNVVK